MISILREHFTKRKAYKLIVRCGFNDLKTENVNLKIELPGKINKVKGIFHMKNNVNVFINDEILNGA